MPFKKKTAIQFLRIMEDHRKTVTKWEF